MRSDWGLYESWRKSFQHKHADMLSDYTHTKSQSCQWIKRGEPIEIDGFLLKRGCFYVGDCFQIPKSYKEKCLNYENIKDYNCEYKLSRIWGPVIQKDLPIERGDIEIRPFSSYYDMHPTHRYEYLSWLTGEKSISEISLSSLAFYLFGIQLRMFLDDSIDEAEKLDIIKYSLEPYVSCLENNIQLIELELFINAAIAYSFKGKELDILNSNSQQNIASDNNSSVLYTICYLVTKSLNKTKTIPNNLISSHFVNQVKSFVTSELLKMVNPSEDAPYLSNYSSLYYQITRESGSFFDTLLCYDLLLNIRILEKYQIFYAIKDSVKSYVKNVSKELKEFNALYKISPTLSLFALPPMFDIHDNVDVTLYLDKLKEKTKLQDYTTISINSILDINEDIRKTEKRIDKAQVTSIIKCVLKMGYGIVPNYFVDETRFNYGDKCILYRENNNEGVNKLVSCRFELLIKVCLYITNGTCTDSDITMIENYVKKEVNNAPTQRYLCAYLRWMLLSSLCKLTKNNKYDIAHIPEDSKKRFVTFVTFLTTYNNPFFPKRLDYLKDVLPLFNVDPQSIHTLIHRIISEDEEFATIEKETKSIFYNINKKAATSNPLITLSTEHLTIVETQTKQAQGILAEIFEDDNTGTDSTNQENNVLMEILKYLLTKKSWKRNEVESLCREHHLMIGSVLEQINDYSYSKIEDAVIEDDGDTINVMTDYKDKLI